MAEGDDGWSTNSNDALKVTLYTSSPTGLKAIASFPPKFTYPIFGEEERIFGYKGLNIDLRYHATDMRPNLTIKHAKKFQAVGDTEPADLPQMLESFLPQVAFQKTRDFESAIQQSSGPWSPPGSLVTSYDTKDGVYEIYKGSLADPAFNQIISRIQIFVSLFVEGGLPIDLQEDADRWTVFLLYRKRHVLEDPSAVSYVFAGYCTVYRFFLYQPPTPPASQLEDENGKPHVKEDLNLGDGNFDISQLPCRMRISQFIILPPFQGKGNGPQLYSTIYQEYLKHPNTFEITVEDPNEAFDDLRDLSDVTFLQTLPEFTRLRINSKIDIPTEKGAAIPKDIVDSNASEQLRRKLKLAPRQFARALEMALMWKLAPSVQTQIAPPDKSAPAKATREEMHEYSLWKLLVKKRLYRQHKDVLGQLDLSERIEKLDQTVTSVELEYARLRAMLDSRLKRDAAGTLNGKRKLGGTEAAEASSSKKARVEDAEMAE